MLDGEDVMSTLKVIDFGACTIFKDKNYMQEIMGTVRWLNYRLIILHQKLLIKNIMKNVIFGVAALLCICYSLEHLRLKEILTKK